MRGSPGFWGGGGGVPSLPRAVCEGEGRAYVGGGLRVCKGVWEPELRGGGGGGCVLAREKGGPTVRKGMGGLCL